MDEKKIVNVDVLNYVYGYTQIAVLGSLGVKMNFNMSKDWLENNIIEYRIPKCSSEEHDERMKENSIKVLTVHTSKGLEANNVIVYGSLWRNDEEIRINYVAATRAKNLLIWMNKINRVKKMENWE